MALHAVDKDTNDRGSPSVNSHDVQGIARMAAGTTSVHPVTDATTTLGYVQSKNARILINDGTNDRVMIGVLPDGTMGFAVSVAGVNVEDAFA